MNATQNKSSDKVAPVFEPSQIIRDYLDSQHVLSLCCYDRQLLWCASCFYLFEPNTMSFLVMTDPKTRHGQMIVRNPNVAGTITTQEIDVEKLQGVQFTGTIALLIGDKEHCARLNFYDRFPIAKLIPSPIWRLKLDEVKMTDNSAGFANKYIWTSRW